MPRTVLPAIEALFTNGGRARHFIKLEWWLVRRGGKPFLLLPFAWKEMREGLQLYSAQRSHAKIWRALLPWMLKTPAAFLFERISFQADADSEIIRFLAGQSGVSTSQLRPFAIKFGGATEWTRLVLLLCDETRRPVSVIKIGLDAAGRSAIDREADLLEKLPSGMIGCIRMNGRLETPALSAFATTYYRGDSPVNDAGMEHLFHAWLNPGPPRPLADLETWKKLTAKAAEINSIEWQILSASFNGKLVRPTLYHGDFAPWNVRAINVQNLQAFDWDFGHLNGIPGWDWFHFFVQTAILARRHSVERVAAEVEQLLHSERFKKYAQAAGINDFAQPLLLAYLLHQKWIMRFGDGWEMTAKLFDLLFSHWKMTLSQGPTTPKEFPRQTLHSGAVVQLKSAATQFSNLFWEPSLAAKAPVSLRSQLFYHWRKILIAGLILAGVAVAHYFTDVHLVFLPFYAIPCAVLTWKVDRRWGALAATVAAFLGPMIQNIKDSNLHGFGATAWNILMRFITSQLCVLFVEQFHKQRQRGQSSSANPTAANFANNWAVVLASGALFVIVAALDFLTDPHMGFLPLYLLPCMILTLILNLRWGIAGCLTAAVCGSLIEYSTNTDYEMTEIFGWNFFMRLAVFLAVVFLLDRIRTGNILFEKHSPPPKIS